MEIADCQLPIANWQRNSASENFTQSAIGNWQLAIRGLI
jgi:hypothetical protein